MKIYLILLAISGICYFIHYLEVVAVIKKSEMKKIKEPCIEEKIVCGIRTLILWALIFPNILSAIIDIFGHEAFEEGIYISLKNSEYWG